ncbi:hypothetical protein O181_019021 [Austropuccinia psidii MF-1]|uniref:Uncharacterized protein n=1 Tax=Austropuccinia psidii MF-1 TaxID=1389203 RepID=A0A9Q3GTG4_9BASI|nr:hypothetical protein [Austropuccinia psidii MF-1]
MKPQPQGHALDDPYHQEDIKPDTSLGNKASSPSEYQDGNNMLYSKKEALKQLPSSHAGPNSLAQAFKGHASIWYTEMKEIHGRKNWRWWNNLIIEKYSNVTWIWQRTMSFEGDKYSVDKDPYEWCLRQSKRLKAIDPQINIQMRNHKLLTQMPGELENAVKCRCNQSCILDDIADTLKDVGKRKNIRKFSQFRRIIFKEKNPFRVDFKDKPKGKWAEVTKKKNTCQNFDSTDHYANNCPKSKKKFYAIEKVPEE